MERHGLSRTAEYRAWCGARQRTSNPQHRGWGNYGGRGITMSPEWRASFLAFLADMGPRPSAAYSLERADVNGPYSAANCIWQDRAHQLQNRRDWGATGYRGVAYKPARPGKQKACYEARISVSGRRLSLGQRKSARAAALLYDAAARRHYGGGAFTNFAYVRHATDGGG